MPSIAPSLKLLRKAPAMKIAIASQNWQTITNHPGKTGRFRIFEAHHGQLPTELPRLDLPKDLFLHNFAGTDSHPLFAMDVIIAGTAGDGFIRRLASQGVRVMTTAEKDPLTAITHFFAGTLPPGAPHDHA